MVFENKGPRRILICDRKLQEDERILLKEELHNFAIMSLV
jgi:hypothetical protein